MRFSKYFTVSVVCVCGAKLDAVLGDDDKNDIVVIVDNTHACPAAQKREPTTIKEFPMRDAYPEDHKPNRGE